MASLDFKGSAEGKDQESSVDLFYDPNMKTVHSFFAKVDSASLILASHVGRTPKINSYQVDPSAKKINKELCVLPADELADMVKAMTAHDPQGYSRRLALKETNLGGREYYVSLAGKGAGEIILTNENVQDAIELMKKKESVVGLSGGRRDTLVSHLVVPMGTDGPSGRN